MLPFLSPCLLPNTCPMSMFPGLWPKCQIYPYACCLISRNCSQRNCAKFCPKQFRWNSWNFAIFRIISWNNVFRWIRKTQFCGHPNSMSQGEKRRGSEFSRNSVLFRFQGWKKGTIYVASPSKVHNFVEFRSVPFLFPVGNFVSAKNVIRREARFFRGKTELIFINSVGGEFRWKPFSHSRCAIVELIWTILRFYFILPLDTRGRFPEWNYRLLWLMLREKMYKMYLMSCRITWLNCFRNAMFLEEQVQLND